MYLNGSLLDILLPASFEAGLTLLSEGKAECFSCIMAYILHASNVVDYDISYRCMQSTMINYEEDCADVHLIPKTSGVWTLPLYFVDGVVHSCSAGRRKK